MSNNKKPDSRSIDSNKAISRISIALNHCEPDRIPIDLGGTPWTGIHIAAYKNLRKLAGLSEDVVKVEDNMQQLAFVDNDFTQLFEIDVRKTLSRAYDRRKIIFNKDEKYSFYEDIWGIKWHMPLEGGFFYDMYNHPLQDAENIDDLEKYHWPDPYEMMNFDGVREKVINTVEQGYMPVLCDCCSGVTTMHAWLRGYEKFYMDFILNPDIAEYIMDKVNEIKMKYWEGLLKEVEGLPYIIVESDDLGGQDRTIYSPKIYRTFVKPRHKKLFSLMKTKSSGKLFFHSCGAIRDVLPDLIEIGIDIINPVQKSASGMDLAQLKKDFGKDVVFWGGGVDTQNILGSGSPNEVRDDVRRSIDALAPGGGFIFAAVHNIQANVPSKNMMEMMKTFRDYCIY